MMKKIKLLTLLIGLVLLTLASEAKNNLNSDSNVSKIEQEIANDKNFPKGYFLIPHNLPFALGQVLRHQESWTLDLNDTQYEQLNELKKKNKPAVMGKARVIQRLEFELREKMEVEDVKLSEITPLLEKIAEKRLELTKQHTRCIFKVKAILTKEQRKILADYIK